MCTHIYIYTWLPAQISIIYCIGVLGIVHHMYRSDNIIHEPIVRAINTACFADSGKATHNYLHVYIYTCACVLYWSLVFTRDDAHYYYYLLLLLSPCGNQNTDGIGRRQLLYYSREPSV